MEHPNSSSSSHGRLSDSTDHHSRANSSAEQQTASASTSLPPSQTQLASDATSEQVRSEQPPSTSSHNEAAPTTTLWENFMASLRNVVHRSPSQSALDNQASSLHTTDTQANPQVGSQFPASTQPAASAGSNTTHPTTADNPAADPSADQSGMPRPPVFFRLPFNGPDGTPALLAFHPQPLPQRDSGPQSGQQRTTQRTANPQPSSATSPSSSPGRPDAEASAASANPHSVPHAAGHVPISPLFVPFGASPLPFSFIYDANTQTAWPIAQVTPGSPPGGPSPDAPESQQPRLVAGPPFRIILDIHFGSPPGPEQPDPEKAANYVKQLERADAELRARMARLGMGSIGGFASASATDDQDALLGCGVCLDNYEAEDRPEWIDGPKSQDEAVVAVPCNGHHTLHAGCLRDWLAKLPPSQWTCPFCRASLSVTPTGTAAQGSSSKTAAVPSVAVHTTLREEVRTREFQRGWRCQAPACLPRYPISSNTDKGHLDLPETSDDMTTELIKLTPCRHEVHLDCLCTSMRVENDLSDTCDLDGIMGNDDRETASDLVDQDDVAATQSAVDVVEDKGSTIGKWVTCPACRKECWAELPLRRKPQRSAPESSVLQLSKPVPLDASAALPDGTKAISAAPLQSDVEPDHKASHLSQTGNADLESDMNTHSVTVTSNDRDEEDAVNAMLVPH